MNNRVFLIVLDSFGIGEMPDSHKWNDEGSNTLGAVKSHPAFHCPTMEKLGLFHIDGVSDPAALADRPAPIAAYARMTEASNGKDTTIGHWEISGIISPRPLPTYPEGFPREVLDEFTRRTGYGVLCNKPYSGTDVIRDFGEEHLATGKLIVYTSADSVFQIAAHEDKVPIDELYRVCDIARDMLTNEWGGIHAVGRVIARPFEGAHPFKRTSRRHDYSIAPPAPTMLDTIKSAGLDSIAVGKITDIFVGQGITETVRTGNNTEGMAVTAEVAKRDFHGICFTNLVDFDMVYGHRNNVEGYAAALTEFDKWLADFLPVMKENDLLIITADHGCDPSTPSTDHSREYTPMLMYRKGVEGTNLGTRQTFADIAATVLDFLGLPADNIAGKSFLKR
ncbi:MAG: phosphopentomutase [Clostridia bacterium]|nr:phosphopentomutase [Clostridia bacterium]